MFLHYLMVKSACFLQSLTLREWVQIPPQEIIWSNVSSVLCWGNWKTLDIPEWIGHYVPDSQSSHQSSWYGDHQTGGCYSMGTLGYVSIYPLPSGAALWLPWAVLNGKLTTNFPTVYTIPYTIHWIKTSNWACSMHFKPSKYGYLAIKGPKEVRWLYS